MQEGLDALFSCHGAQAGAHACHGLSCGWRRDQELRMGFPVFFVIRQ